ncbi:hypothetical protein TNCV_1052521 [Trichonephila clavipes]|nr:hypothetical protein TNCV_1052521 [Trichonephila clavipes]
MWVCTPDKIRRLCVLTEPSRGKWVSLVHKMFHGYSTWSSQLAQETKNAKIYRQSRYPVRSAALATIYKDSSSKRYIEESYEPWDEVGQQTLQYAKHLRY